MNGIDVFNAEFDSWTTMSEVEQETLLATKTNEERMLFLSELLKKASNALDNSDKLKYYQLFDLFRKKYGISLDTLVMIIELGTIGIEAYQKGDMESAETAFRILCEHNDSRGKNNYAYMIRRGETSDTSEQKLLEATHLLREGILNKEPFAFVNMALLFALRYGTDDDWRLSDELMEKMPEANAIRVQSWWQDIGNAGDVEGILVHYFLLRHDKIETSVFGDKEQLSKKLADEISNFPEWLTISPRFSTLDDVFETMLDDDFEENLVEYLDKMPRSREAAEEILDEMTQWDEWELYKVLLQDYVEFLTPEEVAKTVSAYKKKFIIPLSNIVNEDFLPATIGQDESED